MNGRVGLCSATPCSRVTTMYLIAAASTQRAQQTIGVLIEPALLRVVRVREVHIRTQTGGYECMLGDPRAVT